jgi:hypothetical protein
MFLVLLMKKKFKWILLVAPLLYTQHAIADEAALDNKAALSLSGYLETYYIHDFNRQSDGERPNFTYSHNIAGKPSVNLALIKAAYLKENIRGNLAIGSGSYMRANYAAEPDDLQKIYEPNI